MAVKPNKSALDIQREITRLRKMPDVGQYVQTALQRIEDAVNNLGLNTAAAPKGVLPSPPPIQALTVKTNGTGLVHAVVNDSNPIAKNLHYFVEYDTNRAFPQPQVAHLGVSRQMSPIVLPTMDDNGQPQVFYFRAYSQYPGGKPGTPIMFGGETATAVAPGGTQQMTLLPSTGSGTAPASGQRGGEGFGKNLNRASVGPKRKVSS